MTTHQKLRHQELWQHARTLTDLGSLTADWLEGTNSYLPAYGSDADGNIRPARETGPLIPHLARANRNGFVTVHSQPAVELTDGCGQRAFVGGFCAVHTVERIQAACLGTDLVVIATPPAWENPTRIAVSIVGGEDCTWVGAVTRWWISAASMVKTAPVSSLRSSSFGKSRSSIRCGVGPGCSGKGSMPRGSEERRSPSPFLAPTKARFPLAMNRAPRRRSRGPLGPDIVSPVRARGLASCRPPPVMCEIVDSRRSGATTA